MVLAPIDWRVDFGYRGGAKIRTSLSDRGLYRLSHGQCRCDQYEDFAYLAVHAICLVVDPMVISVILVESFQITPNDKAHSVLRLLMIQR